MIDRKYILTEAVALLAHTFTKPAHIAILKDVIMHKDRFPYFIRQLWTDANRLELRGDIKDKRTLDYYIKKETIRYATLITDRMGNDLSDEDHLKPITE